MRDNDLRLLVEKTNKELQEKELAKIKKEGLSQIQKLEESVGKMDEIAISRMASRLAPTSRDRERRELEKMISGGIDTTGNMERLKSMDLEDQDYKGGSGIPGTASFRRQGEKIAQKPFVGPKPEGIKDQIGILKNKMMTVKSREEADRIMDQIKYLQSQMMDAPETTHTEPEMEKDSGMIMQRAMGDKFQS